MKKLNKANVPEFLLDAVAVLADYGIKEESKDALEYNDPSDVQTALMLCFTDKSKLDKFLEKTRWDEEFDLSYDEEVFTLPLAICDILKKYNLVEDSEEKSGRAVGLERIEETSFRLTYKCPHCNRTTSTKNENREKVKCGNCYGEIILT